MPTRRTMGTGPLLLLILIIAAYIVPAVATPTAAFARDDTMQAVTAEAGLTESLETYAAQLLAAAHDEARRSHGRSVMRTTGTTELIWSAELAELARNSSARMARQGVLEHDPGIRDALCCSIRFSNNIGVASASLGSGSVAAVRRATTGVLDLWLASGGHRDNLLDPSVSHLGVGVHLGSDGRLWATVVFQDRASTAADVATETPIDHPTCPVAAPAERFADVLNVHAPAVDCLSELGIVRGTDEGRFDPSGTVTRGQLAMLLDRSIELLGFPRSTALHGAFTDVRPGSYSSAAVERLAGEGIILGRPDGRFEAGVPVTRGQIAVQLEAARRSLHGEVEIGPRGRFSDVPTTRRFSRSIDAGANAGLLAGDVTGRFEPDAPLRRDQAASLLLRFLVEASGRPPASPRPTATRS